MYFLSLFLICTSFLNGLSISGSIYDSESKNPLESVNIIIEELNTGTASDSNGYFQLENLPQGNYKILFSIIGYKQFSQIIDINNTGQLYLDIALEKSSIQWKAINVMGFIPSKHSPETTEIVERNKVTNTDQETLSALLTNLHGIEVQSAHDYGRNVNISIRGSSDFKPGGYNNRVLLLLDGFPVSIPNSGSSDWNAIPFETIKHIEVVRGPASSVYGHNSMGGIVNLVTKTGNYSNEWYPRLRYGSYGSNALSLSYTGSIKNTKIVSSVGYGSSNGHRFNSGYEQKRFSVKLNRSISINQQVQFSFINANSFNGQPGFVYPDNPGLISYRESNRLSSYLQFYYKALLGQSIISVSIASNQFDTDYNDRNDAPENKILGKTHYRDKSYIFRSQLQKFYNEETNLVIGTEISLDQSRSNVLRNIYVQPEQFTTAGFAQFRKEIFNKIMFDFGLRYDFREVKGGDRYKPKLFKAISPKLSLSQSINSKTKVYISINQGFRAPSISELFLEYESSYGLLLQGNPSLNAESLTNIESGFEYQAEGNFSFFGNLFFNRYRDMIDFVYTIPVRSVNRGTVHGKGFELGSNMNLNRTGSIINFNYSYLDMENVKADFPLLYRPNHKIRFTVLQKTPGIDFTLSTKYTSTQLYEDFLSDDHPIENNKVIFPLETLPATFITDFSMSKTLLDYDLTIRIKNLFNRQYVLIQHYPMPGRNFEISINKVIK
tara:strand:+ start:2852 stop:5014 length:2163 start_codon:yes stop_codon:yes gene_type:complete